jgi:sulfofructose kinase
MPNVLVVGAAVLDCVFLMDELPAAAEKYRAKRLVLQGGGTAATTAVTARRLGLGAALIARVGDDQFGARIVDDLVNEGVDCALVRRCPGRRSPVSAVMVDARGERMIVNYKDPDMDADTGWLPNRLPSGVDGVLGDHHWAAATEHVFRLAREAGKPAILDADRMTSKTILRSATHIGFAARRTCPKRWRRCKMSFPAGLPSRTEQMALGSLRTAASATSPRLRSSPSIPTAPATCGMARLPSLCWRGKSQGRR